ncbi:MAG TPA: c-type cytochrome domain-containing protein [Candidatus Limnocylindria bacterium]|nr:c-type cytochrome domain-containing protein [Candidatus Limnocylindria bacterium]
MRHIVGTLFLAIALRAGAVEISFRKEVAPILVAKCLACHNAEKAKGGYRLHNFEALLKPGSSKDLPVVSGNAVGSKLFQLLTTGDEDDRMPQKDEALPVSQIAIIKTWIEQGVKFDGSDRSVTLAVLSPPVHPEAPRSYSAAVPITALAFDLAGEHIAASGYHEITIWNSNSGELVRRIGNVAERTFDLAFSPDGRWLACASGTPGKLGEVKLFNATNGELANVFVTTADAVLCLAFSSDGKTLAAGGADNMIRIWNVESGRLLQTIEQHADWVLALAFSPDGERLASGSRDKSARIFEVKTGELDETYTGHSDFVTAVAWANAKSILSASRTRNVHRWNLKDVKKTAEFSGWDGEPTRLIVSGTNFFSASLDGRVRQHNLETKELVRTFEAHRDAIYSLAFHAGTQRLASGGHDADVRMWNAEDGRLLLKFIAAPGYTPKLSRSR